MESARLCFIFIIIISCVFANDDVNTYHQMRLNLVRPNDFNRKLNYSVDDLLRISKFVDIENILRNVEDDDNTVYDDSFDVPSNVTASPRVFSVSPVCLNNTKAIYSALEGGEQWALKMVDAAGKPEAGLMSMKLKWRGDYDECVGVRAVSQYKFNGKYCSVSVGYGKLPINPITQLPAGIDIGMCLPESCSDTDTKNLLNQTLQRVSNKTVYVIYATCVETLDSYDMRAKIVLAVIGVFIVTMAIATAYDLIIVQRPKSSKKQPMEIFKNGGTQQNGKSNGVFVNDDHKSPDVNIIKSGGTEKPSSKYEEKFKPSENSIVEGKEKYTPGILGQLLLSFSVYTNGAKILNTHQGAGTLTAVNGIRFISMTWVILGHSIGFGAPNMSNLATFFPKMISRRSFMGILNAEVSVDTFFSLSGCLLTYLVLKQLKKQKGKLNWFMFYFHRFWRLTPPYMLVMMVYIALFPYLGSGPIWKKNGLENNYCEDTWWYNLLYIQNFRPITDQCFAWAWYLANDMQFYVISPILLLPLYFNKVAGTIVTAMFLGGTTIATGIISTHYDLGLSTFDKNAMDYFNNYYIKPYTRMGPYLVGIYTGYILYKIKCTFKINKFVNLLLWGVFTAVASSVLYGVYDHYNGKPFSTEVASLYNAVHKTAWGAAVCWVIFACATGNGGFINTILSWKGFVPLSRLTYSAYLIHPVIIQYYVYTRKQMVYVDDHQMIYDFLGNLGLSYAAALIVSLAFESPMMGLEKVIFKRGQKK
ncbi:nose resistant to fluoxetine protein 6-like [Mytilus galloprovincialis]|uniref:nose resistant to fluoxetine protein 6-like n=1 Tax=Mytilus galloprovincialis TaxID=29158 RepID=UPI003F7C7A0F